VGYEVLEEEIHDEGWSGAYMERPASNECVT
jgi:hypothetical protein